MIDNINIIRFAINIVKGAFINVGIVIKVIYALLVAVLIIILVINEDIHLVTIIVAVTRNVDFLCRGHYCSDDYTRVVVSFKNSCQFRSFFLSHCKDVLSYRNVDGSHYCRSGRCDEFI